MSLQKSFGGCIISAGIVEFIKIALLKITNDAQKTMIMSSIIGYGLSYVIQRKVFTGGRFFGISFMKWFSVATIGLQASQIMLHWLINQE